MDPKSGPEASVDVSDVSLRGCITASVSTEVTTAVARSASAASAGTCAAKPEMMPSSRPTDPPALRTSASAWPTCPGTARTITRSSFPLECNIEVPAVCTAGATAMAATTVTQLATAVDHCQPRGADRGNASTNPFPDIVIVLLRRDESDVGFATRSPPAQATKYSPEDQHAVLESPVLPYVGPGIGHAPRELVVQSGEMGKKAHRARECAPLRARMTRCPNPLPPRSPSSGATP